MDEVGGRGPETLMYIKLPMYLFYYMVYDIVSLRRWNPLLGGVEGVGPESRDFFWAQ